MANRRTWATCYALAPWGDVCATKDYFELFVKCIIACATSYRGIMLAWCVLYRA